MREILRGLRKLGNLAGQRYKPEPQDVAILRTHIRSAFEETFRRFDVRLGRVRLEKREETFHFPAAEAEEEEKGK